MLKDLEYVQETIELRKDDIRDNEFETNDLLIEDILKALGYNKKRDTGVKAVYSGEVNWQVSINGENRFVVYVKGFGCEEQIGDIPSSVISYAGNNEYPFIISTDGQRLSVSTSEKQLIYIPNIFDDGADEQLTLMSKQGWNAEKLVEIASKLKITAEDITKLIQSDEGLKCIASLANIDYTDSTKDQLQVLVNEALTTNTAGEGASEVASEVAEARNNAEILELKTHIESLESELQSTNEQLKAKDEEIKQLQEHLESEKAKAQAEDTEATKQLETLESSISELEQKKGLLETEIAELENKKQSVEQAISELDNQEKSIEQQKSVLSTEIAGLSSKKEALSSELNQLSTKKEELEGQITELEQKSSNIETSAQTNQELEDLRAKAAQQEQEIESLNKKLSDAANAANAASAMVQTSDSGEDTSELHKLIDQLREENERLHAESKQDMYKDLKFETEGAYREKIAAMSSEIQKLTAGLQDYKDKFDEIERIKAGQEDERIVLGRTLLEAVEENLDLQRTYVGVVDSKLFQVQDATKFVGTCLQELYNVVQFDLMQILFDGDVFKIVQPAVRGDLMINTKKYDIDLGGFSEIDIINRLKAVFNKFPNVVFMCKTIGTYSDEVFQTQIHSSSNNLANQSGQTGFDDTLDLDEQGASDIQWDSVPTTDLGEATGEQQYQDIDNSIVEETQPSITYLGASFQDAAAVTSDVNTPVYNIAAIGDNSRLFKIKNETYYDIITCGIMSVLSILNSTKNGVLNLQNNDLLLLDERITTYENATEQSILIPFSQYYATVNSVYDCVMVITSIARMLGISEQQAFFYFSANYSDDPQYSRMFIQGDQINLERHIPYDELVPSKQTINCMVYGTDVRMMSMAHETKALLEKMVNSTMAFRRKPERGTSFKELQHIADFLATRIDSMLDRYSADDAIAMINQGLDRYVISASDEEMSNERVEMILSNNSKYYLDTMSGYECMMLMLSMNAVQFGDDMIELRLDINSTLYNVFKDGIDTSDSIDYLTSRLFLEIIEGKTKVIA